MTKILVEKAVIEQALEALESKLGETHPFAYDLEKAAAIRTLREALAEQAEQEPVAWMQEMPTRGNEIRSVRMTTIEKFAHEEWVNPIPLYAAPVRTKDLTDDEVLDVFEKAACHETYRMLEGCRAVIAADREKNK